MDGGRMSREVLRVTVAKVAAHCKDAGVDVIHFVWHGGEPLLTGLSFFQYALSVMTAQAIPFRNFIQTNGLLLDDDFCSFFRDNDFQVGISLDGPAEVHDKLRVYRDGRGSHAQVMAKIELAAKHQLRLGCCAVATRFNTSDAASFYGFFRGIGLGFRVNPVLPASRRTSGEYLLAEDAYGRFLCQLFDVWTTTGAGRVSVAPLDRYLRSLTVGSSRECQHSASCVGTNIGIRPNGETLLCSRFESHYLGSIMGNSITQAFSSPAAMRIAARGGGPGECARCSYRTICYGGCPLNAFAITGAVEEKDPFCTDYRIVFNHISAVLRESAGANGSGQGGL